MSASFPSPAGESLRRAVAWLAEHGWSLALIQQACERFDLSPVDEEFLLQAFRRMREQPER